MEMWEQVWEICGHGRGGRRCGEVGVGLTGVEVWWGR